MAYRNDGGYNGQQTYQGQYDHGHEDSTVDDYGYPQNGGQAHAQPPYTNGGAYGSTRTPNGQVYQHAANYQQPQQSPRAASYAGYPYGEQTLPHRAASTQSYNPREYAQPTSQYNPQAYGTSSPPYAAPQPSYNPAAYAPSYTQPQIGSVQPQHGYSPGNYSSPAFGSSQFTAYSPTPSNTSFHTPPSGYESPLPNNNQAYQSPHEPVQHHGYSTYTQPSSQMAYSSFAPSPPAPQYNPHDYQQPSTTVTQSSYMNISPALPGLPIERSLPSPPTYSTLGSPPLHDPRDVSPIYSPASQISSSPGPTPPIHGLHRTETGRHPHSRPLPGPPQPDSQSDYFTPGLVDDEINDIGEEEPDQDELMGQIEAAVNNPGSPASVNISGSRSRNHVPLTSDHSPQPLFSSFGGRGRSTSTVNGHLSPEPPSRQVPEEDSDAEAQAGLEAMRAAEQEEIIEERRRQSGASGLFNGFNQLQHSGSQRSQRDGYDSEDYATVDVGLVGGGFEAPFSYGGDPNALAAGGEVNGAGSSQAPSSLGSFRSTHDREGSYDYGMDSIHPFPEFRHTAEVTAGSRGLDGNRAPASLHRRQSFDEGDEFAFTDENLVPGDPPDLFYHPGVSAHRPLPPPPASLDVSVTSPSNTISSPFPPYPLAPDAYVQSTTNPGMWVPRSSLSLVQHSSTPPAQQPIRSKTDAEERLRRQGYRGSVYSTYENTPVTSAVAIDLPSLPTKRFNPAKLGGADFKKCEEPWALSAVLRWLQQVADPEQMTELKESMIKEALVALFTNKVPTMNIADAETLSNRVVEDMFAAGVLITTEEWVRFNPGPMSGVIFQLTQSGCYSPTLHDHIIPGRCYSHHCQRTLRKVNLQGAPVRATEDWATFYHLKKEDVEGMDKKEIERQNILHEIVQTEDDYMDQLNVLRLLYRDPLASAEPPIISPKKLQSFLKDVFAKVEAIKRANEDNLLAQLKYRQEEQGPWIKGFSDIFRQWIRKAKVAYIEYAAGFPNATLLVQQELERNFEFATFVDKVRSHKNSKRLGWDTYLKAPITRLQRYTLLLSTVHRNMKQESEEKNNLQVAIDEIKTVTLECDSRVAEMQRKVDLADLGQRLILRPGMQGEVELNLNHLGRELVFRGDLQRTGGSRFNWLDCHTLLFDHYLILAKTIAIAHRGSTSKIEKYDVSRLPIPMDLLVLESVTDDAVMKSTYVRGITSMTTVPTRPSGTPDPNRLSRTTTSQSPVPSAMDRTNTASSINSLHPTMTNSSMLGSVTNTEGSKDSDRIVYPIRIKHLGREQYVLFAPSHANRLEWRDHIISAKTKHAHSLHAQNAEPFKLRVIADSAFYYDYSQGGFNKASNIIIQGTPTDRAIKEVERKFKDTGRPSPVCRAKVNCSTSFTTPYPGRHMVAVGSDYGVFVSEMDNPRGWSKAISAAKVTQVAVLEEFNLFLLISNGSLIAYHLDTVCSSDRTAGAPAASDTGSSRKAPQKLSGRSEVGFFAIGRMKDRTLVMYKKRDGLSSTFKVLEPVFQKSTEKKRGIFKRGTTEFFREYDEFYIPTECSGINLFSNSLAVSTNKGFEVLTLDKKQSFSVPDLKAPEVANIATHIENQQTLGMLRLSDQEFLLCYEKCAVYVNKHGDVSRSVIMNFVGKAKSAALYGPYLILFDNDFVEIRNSENGRLKQIIAGREVRCLDDGGGGTVGGGSINPGVVNGVPALGAGSKTVKMAMQHPENDKIQIVVELVLNERLKE